MAKFTTLYSGSSGNAGVLWENGRYLLIDMGCSCRATLAALGQAGLGPEGLQGILVTHEHIDHIRGLAVFLKRWRVPVYTGYATLDTLWRSGAVPEETELVAVDGRSEDLCGFGVRGFATSHDAVGSCGYRITTPKGAVMALATDLGKMTSQVYSALAGASLVALEANYDAEMLRTGPYPAMLKRRIASTTGHLSNTESAFTVAKLAGEGCRRFVMCHLSQENNEPALVRSAVNEALEGAGLAEQCAVHIAPRHSVGEWVAF